MVNDRVKRYLDEHFIEYETVRHEDAYTAQEAAERLHVKGRMMAKVVIVKSEREFMMVVLPADRRVDIVALKSGLGVSMIAMPAEDEFASIFPDCEPGAMPPFGNLYGVQVYVDSALLDCVDVVFQAGTHSEAVMMDFADFLTLAHPKILDVSRKAA